ncbi:MAG: NAD(P)H nitroreductase [Bacteroidetes bacterium GWF2_38_335]|nr:MAG: NAD(P)H nitroreductase [Bacteroidetes bacterium GWF2_38_335]OFY76958.1 MAG: NAD(P)H nitroreductase [Bacteroidetes bacterium RIFOXYA12_FULL_38_20]HBS86812.1 NAD(P)H nitroreductase [Bacteroidales bacterium]
MKLIDIISARQSVRKYSDKPVDREKIIRCLEAARLAPSACNSQPWKFIVVDEPGLKSKVAKETYGPLIRFNKFAAEAPVMIVVVIEKPKLITQIGETLKNKEYPLIDLGIACEHFCLQAQEDGLGTCMLGWFNEKPLKKLLNIPEKRTIGLVISLGYAPDGYKQRMKIRKTMEEMSGFNGY